MQLTSFTDYGLRSLMYLAKRADRISSVKEIAEYYGISRHHLVKVVHCLGQLGYIETTKGKGGGIRLLRDAKKLRLGELIVALEPSMVIVECFDKATNTCRIADSCQLKRYLREAYKAFIETLNQYTLADVMKHPGLFSELSNQHSSASVVLHDQTGQNPRGKIKAKIA